MSRKVARHRSALGVLALVAALAALAAPAAARAETLTLTPESDAVAGLPTGIGYEYDTGGVQLNLVIIVRPSSGPPCATTPNIDAAQVGTSGGLTYVTPTPIALTGHGLGRVPFTYTSPDDYRICGWLTRTPDDVAIGTAADADVRLPHAGVAVTASQESPRAGGSGLQVEAKGTTEAPADLFVTAVAATGQCPPTYDDATDPLAFDVVPAGTNTRVNGDFDLQFSAHDLLSFRAWRVCAYLQDGTTAAAASATGSTVVDLLLPPQSLRRPRLREQGSVLTCDGGRWKAKPAARTSIAWLVGGRPLAGARGGRLAVSAKLRGKEVRCRVTAKNRLGTATATSRTVRVR